MQREDSQNSVIGTWKGQDLKAGYHLHCVCLVKVYAGNLGSRVGGQKWERGVVATLYCQWESDYWCLMIP